MRWSALPLALAGLTIFCTLATSAAEPPYGLKRRIAGDTCRLNGTPEPPPPYRTRRVFERIKFDRPLYLIAEPTSERLLVVEQGGKVVAFKNDPATDKTDPFVVLPDHDTYGMTFHPDYARNRQVFIFANGPNSHPKLRYNRIYRFEVGKDGAQLCDPKSKRLIIEWASNGHNGGDLLFGKDGLLYITSGDSTSDSDGDVTGQDLRDLCSGVLRIDVDRPDPGKGYAVPRDNPFLHMKDAKPELFAFGFRNPWRMAMDPGTGTILIGDVGQDLWEMIQLLKRGGNYGWSVFEGTRPFYPNRKLGPGAVVPPLIEHPHSESRSITGGQFYRGCFKDLHGAYIYGDYATGKVWGLRQENGKVVWQKELASTRLQTVGFGLDRAGDLYLVDYGGQIHTLERNPPPATKHNFPRKLSETGLFTSVAGHRPQPGLIPYSVNSPLWSDGAFKERFIALPGLEPIDFHESNPWRFPEGTVLVKTFSLEREVGNLGSRRRIETRLLTFQQGEWQGYSYQWNDDQSDAELVSARGADKTFTLAGAKATGGKRQQTWHYPSRVECMVCHSRAANYVLGLSTMQMNKIHDYGGVKDNQLRTLEHIGAFRGGEDHLGLLESRCRVLSQTAAAFLPRYLRERALKPVYAKIQAAWEPLRPVLVEHLSRAPAYAKVLTRPPASYQKLADPADAAADLTFRARSYLQANCAHCHVAAGGGNSAIELHINTDLADMRLLDNKPLHDTFGLPDARLVAPGAPERSVLLHRLATTGRGRMPPLSSAVVDEEAVGLLREWIKVVKAPAVPAKK